MLVFRRTIICTFLITLSFFITFSLAHPPTVIRDSTVGGEFPSINRSLYDGGLPHLSITASAGAKKEMETSGIKLYASAQVRATQNLTFPDGSVGTPYGHWQYMLKFQVESGLMKIMKIVVIIQDI